MNENNLDEQQINDLISSLAGNLKLSNEDRDLLVSNPNILHTIYADVGKSVLIYHFADIISAIVDKAKNGDTTSAKFISEFIVQFTQATDHDNAIVVPAIWESKAIEIRDYLQLELSAEVLVVELLNRITINEVIDILHRDS